MAMKKGSSPLLRLFLTAAVMVAVVFLGYEVVERWWLRPTHPDLLYYMHIVRGAGTALIVAGFLLGYLYVRGRLGPTDLGLLNGTHEKDDTGRREAYGMFSRWFIRLRWVALAAVTLFIYAGGWIVPLIPSSDNITRLLVLTVLLALINVGYAGWVRGWEPTYRHLAVQMLTDLVFLTLLLHLAGGLENPAFFLFVFHTILAGVMFRPGESYVLTGVGALLLLVLGVSELAGLVGHHALATGYGGTLHENPFYVFGWTGSMVIVMFGTNFFTTSMMTSLRSSRGRLRQEMKRSRRLLQKIMTAQEDERRRVSRELHDQVGQTLTALRMQLRRIRERCGGAIDLCQQLEQKLEAAIDEVRTLSSTLRPSLLDESGLDSSLAQFASMMDERYEGTISYQSAGSGSSEPLPEEVRIALYRVCQEAVFNAVKHADPGQTSVILNRVDARVRLLVEDDGSGFDPGGLNRGSREALGVQGMRERMDLIGGVLEIESAPGEGTRVRAEVDLREEERWEFER